MSTPLEILKKYWGYEAFRPLQEDIIKSILAGQDTLALLPTGGGKSICYQVPGLIMEGVSVIITPLIALMRDQVAQLKSRNIPAVAIHSGLSRKDIDRELDNCVYGNYKFLYLSPERLQTDLAKERLSAMKISQLVVDEAHCISQWGFDFRPSYLNISDAREYLTEVPIMALTATATDEVKKDIVENLDLKDVQVFVKSFKRDNISFFVFEDENRKDKLLYLSRRIPGTKIIYVRNRRKTREVSMMLQKEGFNATYYHAGLDVKNRMKVEKEFMDGKKEVIVSTNAFGMGIDKSDVRAVFHLDLPSGLEEYYQEAGRAGRDGKESYAILFCREKERRNLMKSVEASFPAIQTIRRVYKALCIYYDIIPGGGIGESYDFDINSFSSRFGFSVLEVFHSLKQIEAASWIHLSDAVYHPPKVMVLVDNMELYDYQLKTPALDPFIKTLLRSYEGLFSVSVSINLKSLARKTNADVGVIEKALRRLARDKIIHYQPPSDQPRVTFLQPRATSRDFDIDQKRYQSLKQRAVRRMKAMIYYTRTEDCRMNNMLAYFDEKAEKKCGKCDICRGLLETEPSHKETLHLKAHFLKVLDFDPQPFDYVLETVSFIKRKKAIKVLEYLEAEGWLAVEGENIRLLRR